MACKETGQFSRAHEPGRHRAGTGALCFPKAAAKAAAKPIGISGDIPGDHAKKQRAKLVR